MQSRHRDECDRVSAKWGSCARVVVKLTLLGQAAWWPSVFLVAAIVHTGCKPSAAPARSVPTAKVTVVEAVTEQVVDFDEFVGRTEASETVEVRARVSGEIKDVRFKDGDYVQAGQVLFLIEPEEYIAIHQQSLSRIDVWEAKVELTQSQLVRSKRLIDANAISQDEYEEKVAAVKEAKASLVAAKADADRTSLDVKYTEVMAPIAGKIDRAIITKGNMVTGGLGSGTLLTRIVNNDPMFVYFDVDERSILRYQRMLSSKQDASNSGVVLKDRKVPCRMQLADESGFPHEGLLDFVENRVDSGTGTIRLRGEFANADRLLTGGLFVRVQIPVSDAYEAVLIPEQSIASDQNVKYVWVVGDDSIARRRDIQLGSQRGAKRVVKNGIRAGEKVVYRGIQRVRPEQKVDAEVLTLPVTSGQSSEVPTANAASQPAEQNAAPAAVQTPSN